MRVCVLKKSIIDRKLNRDLDKEFNAIGRAMDAYVDYGNVTHSKLLNMYGDNKLSTPLYTLHAHILSMLDGISVMVKKGIADGIKPLLRSLFEAALYLEYMLKSSFEEVIAYQVHDVKNKIKTRRMFDLNDSLGKETKKIFENEGKGINLGEYPIDESCKYLFAFLERDDVRKVNEDWNKKKPKNWYSLYSNLNNFRELAKHLKKETDYIIIYKFTSEFLHAGSMMDIVKVAGDKGGISLRSPEEVPLLSTLTFNIINEINLIIGKDDFANWYLNTTKKQVERTSKVKIDVEFELI